MQLDTADEPVSIAYGLFTWFAHRWEKLMVTRQRGTTSQTNGFLGLVRLSKMRARGRMPHVVTISDLDSGPGEIRKTHLPDTSFGNTDC